MSRIVPKQPAAGWRGSPSASWPIFRGLRALAVFCGLAIVAPAAQAEPLKIVAAESVYGDIAGQIGGAEVEVVSILKNPDQDPHAFDASPSTARLFAQARVVIYNGAGYDPWAVKLLRASPAAGRIEVAVAELVHKQPGDNPHVWYEPDSIRLLAGALAQILAKLDRAHAADYQRRLVMFEASMQRLTDQIAALRRKYAGTPVTATEPVFGYMAAAVGLDMRNRRFQLAVMNGSEPSPGDIAAFERDLRSRAVKVLIYNRQTSDALTLRMREIAQRSGVPVLGVNETEPAGKDYQGWMREQLDALDRALAD